MNSNMCKGIIFAGGEGPEPSSEIKAILSGASVTVAADSGLYLAEKLDINCDYIVGDMDSLKNAENIEIKYPNSEIFRYERDKDFTDTELALSLLKEKGCKEVILVGGSGGRTSHFFGIFSLFYRDFCPSIWIMKDEIAYTVEGNFTIATSPGQLLSVFPVSRGICKMKSNGLKWPLDNLCFKSGDAGISNVAVGEEIKIQMMEGKLFLIKEKVPE